MTIPASAEAPPTQRRDPKPITQTVSQASCLPLALQLRITPNERFCGHLETRREHISLPFPSARGRHAVVKLYFYLHAWPSVLYGHVPFLVPYAQSTIRRDMSEGKRMSAALSSCLELG